MTVANSASIPAGTSMIAEKGANGTLAHAANVSLIVSAPSLPAGWTDADIGAVGLAGSASYSAGTFTVKGSGADIWNAADQFNYAFQSIVNDVTITARVGAESGTASFAKAGVMIR